MNHITEWLALAITLLGVLSSSIIALLVYRTTRQAQKAEVQREIVHIYDRMMDFRAARPEVLALSRSWSGTCFKAIYVDHGVCR